MHDLVHDLAQLISESEICSSEDSTVSAIPHVRHLALSIRGEKSGTFLSKEMAEYLHTLVLENVVHVLMNMLFDFKCLRVLLLNEYEIENLPNSISKLIHLRYLDLSCTRIKVLPKSIGKLYNLQTLRLEGCDNLEELPIELSKLISLRHLHLDPHRKCQLPLGMGRLTCLQTLSFFHVGRDKGRGIEELGYLKYLRVKVRIKDLEHVSGREAAERADLFGKTNLYELTFKWSNGREG